MESGAVGWTHLSNPGTNNTGLDTWELSSARTSSGVNAWYAKDTETKTDQLLISPAIVLPGVEESPITLYFSNYQHFEDPNSDGRCWDAGILEVSTDGGTNWSQIPNSELLTDPYDNVIWNNTPGNNPITEDYGATQAWCANPQDWLISAVDLDAYAGQTVNFRWRIGTDSAAGNEGWYIDDVSVQSCQTPATAGFDHNSPIQLGETAVFTNTTVGSPPLTYSWDFGDGSGTSTDENPTYTYAITGTFTVSLTASNAFGTDTFIDTFDVIDVDDTPTLYLPAVFKADASPASGTAALPFGGLILLPAMVGIGFFSYWRRKRSDQ